MEGDSYDLDLGVAPEIAKLNYLDIDANRR